MALGRVDGLSSATRGVSAPGLYLGSRLLSHSGIQPHTHVTGARNRHQMSCSTSNRTGQLDIQIPSLHGIFFRINRADLHCGDKSMVSSGLRIKFKREFGINIRIKREAPVLRNRWIDEQQWETDRPPRSNKDWEIVRFRCWSHKVSLCQLHQKIKQLQNWADKISLHEATTPAA